MDLSTLSDDELFGRVEALAQTERFTLVDFLIHLGELDERPACEKRGYASVFAYLTRHLGYSESDAMRRVRTARAARKYPSILGMLAKGEAHLVSIALLEPILNSENHQGLLRKACRRTTREVERLVADLLPAACEPPDRIRALPSSPRTWGGRIAPMTGPAHSAPSFGLPLPPDSAEPGRPLPDEPAQEARATERRQVFTFTAGEEVRGWFEQARDLLRHTFPKGRMEEVIGEALRRLVEQELPGRERRRRSTAPVAANSRRIAKWIQDEVWKRDGGRCAYAGPGGVRCGETSWLEYDHTVPWSQGGRSDDPANIRLLCRAHNQAEAARLLGPRRRS